METPKTQDEINAETRGRLFGEIEVKQTERVNGLISKINDIKEIDDVDKAFIARSLKNELKAGLERSADGLLDKYPRIP